MHSKKYKLPLCFMFIHGQQSGVGAEKLAGGCRSECYLRLLLNRRKIKKEHVPPGGLHCKDAHFVSKSASTASVFESGQC